MKYTGPLLALAVVAALLGAFAYQQRGASERAQTAALNGAPAVPASTEAAGAAAFAEVPPVDGATTLPPLELDKQGRILMPGESLPLPQRTWPTKLEQALVQDQAVDAGLAAQLLESKDFDGYLAQLSRDTDAEGLARTRDYRDVLEESLAEVSKGARLDRIACGRDFCIAAIEAGAGSDFGAWYRTMQDATPLPMKVLMAEKYARADGATERRVFFSTNPEVASVRMVRLR